MAYLDELTTIRDQIVARIKEVTAEAKPSYSVDGQTIQWSAYLRALRNELAETNLLLLKAQGPFEHRTQGFT